MKQESVFGCLSIVVLAFVVLGLFAAMLSDDTGNSREGESSAAFCVCGVCPIVVVGIVVGAAWVGLQQNQTVQRRARSFIMSEPLVEPRDVADLAMDGVIKLDYRPPVLITPYRPSWLLDYLWTRGFRLARDGFVLSYFQMDAALTRVDKMSDSSLILATLNDADYRFVHHAGPVSDAVALATLRDAVVAGATWVGRQQDQTVQRRPRSSITSKPLVEPLDVADLAMDGVITSEPLVEPRDVADLAMDGVIGLNYERTGPNTPYCPSRLLDYLWSRGFRLSRGGVVLSYFQAGVALTVVDGMSDPSLILATLNDAEYKFIHYAGPVSDAVSLATLRDVVAVCP